MRFLIIAVVLALSGCDELQSTTYGTPEYVLAQRNYTCTTPEFQKVQAEAKFCDENTDTFSSACFGFAIMRNCTKKATSP
jgi:hypothetical protein